MHGDNHVDVTANGVLGDYPYEEKMKHGKTVK
jgi:hypothetical protein